MCGDCFVCIYLVCQCDGLELSRRNRRITVRGVAVRINIKVHYILPMCVAVFLVKPSSSWLHVANKMVGNFMSIRDNYLEKKCFWKFLPLTGIIREWCCMCPAYIGMPHTTNLELWEFQQMMVMDVEVTKNF